MNCITESTFSDAFTPKNLSNIMIFFATLESTSNFRAEEQAVHSGKKHRSRKEDKFCNYSH